ncbi:MAG: AbrB/MazE/SpoVT family DNA-binding domain-containing protein [Candidatus Wallbacteria bacterium]|nr:AbrB/MazE/SpoVT family DNA-binding domain-containing protein [Candidatus Wallbacteria bacterium]
MIKHLFKHGNSLALLIDKSILELLGADEKTEFHLTTDGRSLVISPISDPDRPEKLKKTKQKGKRKYSRMLKKLAE